MQLSQISNIAKYSQVQMSLETILVKGSSFAAAIGWGVAFVPVLFFIAFGLGLSREDQRRIFVGLSMKSLRIKWGSYREES